MSSPISSNASPHDVIQAHLGDSSNEHVKHLKSSRPWHGHISSKIDNLMGDGCKKEKAAKDLAHKLYKNASQTSCNVDKHKRLLEAHHSITNGDHELHGDWKGLVQEHLLKLSNHTSVEHLDEHHNILMNQADQERFASNKKIFSGIACTQLGNMGVKIKHEDLKSLPYDIVEKAKNTTSKSDILGLFLAIKAHQKKPDGDTKQVRDLLDSLSPHVKHSSQYHSMTVENVPLKGDWGGSSIEAGHILTALTSNRKIDQDITIGDKNYTIRDMGTEDDPLRGYGGNGRVFFATDKDSGKEYALKVLAVPSDSSNEGIKEAQHHLNFAHNENLLGAHQVGYMGTVTFILTDLLEGEDLEGLSKNPANKTQSIEMLADAANGLEEVHAQNVVHADVRPDNIMGGKLFDYGLCRKLEGDHDKLEEAEYPGGPGYIAPEVFEGKIGKSSDIFSMGSSLYRILESKRPPEAPPPNIRGTLMGADYSQIDWKAFAKKHGERASNLVQNCVTSDPQWRPSASDVQAELRAIAAEYRSAGEDLVKGSAEKVKSFGFEEHISQEDLESAPMENLQKFMESKDMRVSDAVQLLSQQVHHTCLEIEKLRGRDEHLVPNSGRRLASILNDIKKMPEEHQQAIINSKAMQNVFPEAIGSIDASEIDSAIKLFAKHSSTANLEKALDTRFSIEIEKATSEGSLLRGNSAGSKLLNQFCKKTGIEKSIHDQLNVKELVEHADLEMDPVKRSKDDSDNAAAAGNLGSVTAATLEKFSKFMEGSSDESNTLSRVLANIHANVEKNFQGVGSKAAIGGQLFLRILSPVITAPDIYLGEGQTMPPDERRKRVLLGKVIQNIGNGIEFDGTKEAFMEPINQHIGALIGRSNPSSGIVNSLCQTVLDNARKPS